MSELRDAIYKKYFVPTKRKAKDCVGVEFELPIVNMNKEAVDFNLIHNLAVDFIEHFSFSKSLFDDNNNIYSAINVVNNDNLSFDCSYNTLEFSFGATSNLNDVYARFKEYYVYVQDYLKPYNHTLTGMGINPYRHYNNNEPIPNERYRMLFNHLNSYERYEGAYHDYPEFGLFSAANQVQLDVEENNIVDVINTFYLLEPLKSLLFANSILDDMLCSRDYLWKHSLHGFNLKNVDGYDEPFECIEDVLNYIEGMSMYCIMREGKYVNFKPVPLTTYFASKSIEGEYYEDGEYKHITIVPRIEDLEYLRSFKFEDLTFRGTVEFRSVCEQPVNEIMASSALHAGLMKKIYELDELLKNDTVIYNHGYNVRELRELFNKGEIPDYIDKDKLKDLLHKIIDLAAIGLSERGYGEEHFIKPLYRRADNLLSPAKEILDGLKEGKEIEYYINKFAILE